MIFLLTLPFRMLGLGYKVGSLPVKVTHGTARFVGYRRLFVFAAGVGVGLLIAPESGAKMRARIQALLEERGGAGGTRGRGDLATAVRDELAASPRTWHLPQPAVAVDGSTVILTGQVPHEAAIADLERAARTVPGVTSVDLRLFVAPAGS